MVAARRNPWDSPSNRTSRQGTPRSASAAANRSDWSAGTTGSSAPWRAAPARTPVEPVDGRPGPVGGRRPRATDRPASRRSGTRSRGCRRPGPRGRSPRTRRRPRRTGRTGSSAPRAVSPPALVPRMAMRRPSTRPASARAGGVAHAVVDVGLAPAAVEPPAVRPPVAAAPPVVDGGHGQAPAGEELDDRVEPALGGRGRAAVAEDHQRRWAARRHPAGGPTGA